MAGATDKVEQQIERLQHRHEALAEQVDAMERRRYLSPDEELHVTELKKQKLATKDALSELQRD